MNKIIGMVMAPFAFITVSMSTMGYIHSNLSAVAMKIMESKSNIQYDKYRLDCLNSIVVKHGAFDDRIDFSIPKSVEIRFVKRTASAGKGEDVIIEPLFDCPR